MAYGDKEYRESRDKEIREWLASKVETINSIPDNYLKALCYFSVLDCFAQEYSNYPTRDVTNAFCNFVLKFQRSYVFLNMVDPVTLFYHFEQELKKAGFDLSFMNNAGIYNPDLAIKSGYADQMIKALKQLNINEIQINKHKYVNLLYSLRSKLSHEASPQGGTMWSDHHLLENYPYYISCSRSFVLNDTIERDEVWELTVPVGFIKKLSIECIHNYLDFSLSNKSDPFENDVFTRKSKLSWYDK